MADLDVVTLAEAKDRLGGSLTKTSDDTDIQAAITALSGLFDDRFGAVVQREITGEEITRPWISSIGAAASYTTHYVPCWTEYWPIVGTPTASAGTVIVKDRKFGRVELSISTAATITYTAGRFANTAAVSEQFKAAFVVTLRNWRQASHIAPHVPANPDYPAPRTAFPTFALPNATAQMLSKYRRPEGLA